VIERGVAFWLAVAVAVALMSYGVWLAVEAMSGPELRGLLVWLVGGDVVLDWLLLPAVGLVGAALARGLPPFVRAPVQAGLIVASTVLAVGWLPLHRTAAAADNPTIQPLDYGPMVLAMLGVVALGTLTWTVVRWRRR
jgi:hypothetical protein